MIISEETVIDILNRIKDYLYYKDEKSSSDIILSNELNYPNYYDSSYKIIEVFKHDYIDLHFQVNSLYYDCFVYQDEDINNDRLMQLILCDNYVSVIKFKQGDYDNRKNVTGFKLPQKVYSFYDNALIIVQKNDPTDGLDYKKI